MELLPTAIDVYGRVLPALRRNREFGRGDLTIPTATPKVSMEGDFSRWWVGYSAQ